MNLDVKTPNERIRNIIEAIHPYTIITDHKYSSILENIDIPIILIDSIIDEDLLVDENILNNSISTLIDTDPICIINTSGSTGTPKGVILNHRSFIDFILRSNEIFHFDGAEIMGCLSPMVFDIFDFELCMMMAYGSKMVLLDAMLASFPVRLLETITKFQVNFLFWVPSIMVNIANMLLLDNFPLPDLKLVWFVGEVFPTKQFLYWYDKLTDTVFVNLYGPIEITLDCTYYIINY